MTPTPETDPVAEARHALRHVDRATARHQRAIAPTPA